MTDIDAARTHVARALAERGDPEAARGMAAYMKSEIPCHGVTKQGRVPIQREVVARWPPESHADYVRLVEAIWSLPHREEKYVAIGVARAHPRFISRGSIPLYRRMIVSGGWWDFVDEIAIHLVGRVLQIDRSHLTPIMRSWIEHEDMWVRRASIICQIAHKDRTDPDLLFDACAARAHETDFFIRKAIGWALRSYAYVDADAVRAFVDEHELSGLSRREATKHLRPSEDDPGRS